MSCPDRPPPGFGAAAAGGGLRPPRMDFGELRVKIVHLFVKNNTTMWPLHRKNKRKEQNKRNNTCTKTGAPCTSDLSLFGQPTVVSKNVKLEDNQGATELRRLQTPINIFEDECAFCHSFRTSEKFHGPVILYREGKIVSSNEGNPTNAIYVHKNCMDWAPRVYHEGDIYVNVEKEISRASRLKCSRCRLPGAALGCYHKPCAKTYHVPCAVMIPECSWDLKNRHVWCPKHASDPLPCDGMSSPTMESDAPSPILQNQCLAKEKKFVNCHMEDKQMNPLATPDSLFGQYLDTQRMSVIHRRDEQQVDQPNNSSSFFMPRGQCLDKKGISTNCRREEKQTNRSRTPVNQWVLLGSVLSASEKDSLKEFASLTRSTLAEEWDKNVTHVIVGRSAGNACGASYEVLMAILSGKWVVSAGWIMDCLAEPIPGPKSCLAELIPGPEISYEVKFFNGFRTSIDGPSKGRAGAAEGAPKLFSGLYFCLSAYMNPDFRENIKNLIAAAEGKVLEGMSQHSLQENLDKNPMKAYFIYVGGPPRDKEIEAIKYVASGAQAISHLWLFDAIACYDARMLERRFTLNMYAKTVC